MSNGESGMSDDLLSFEEHRQRRDENSVRCTRCGRFIPATAIRCPECGVHFQGEAYDFTHPADRGAVGGRMARWTVVVVSILLAALVLSAAGR
jgi:hypothetical protein